MRADSLIPVGLKAIEYQKKASGSETKAAALEDYVAPSVSLTWLWSQPAIADISAYGGNSDDEVAPPAQPALAVLDIQQEVPIENPTGPTDDDSDDIPSGVVDEGGPIVPHAVVLPPPPPAPPPPPPPCLHVVEPIEGVHVAVRDTYISHRSVYQARWTVVCPNKDHFRCTKSRGTTMDESRYLDIIVLLVWCVRCLCVYVFVVQVLCC